MTCSVAVKSAGLFNVSFFLGIIAMALAMLSASRAFSSNTALLRAASVFYSAAFTLLIFSLEITT